MAKARPSPNRLRLSAATSRVQSSAIRDLFGLLSRPEVISLAGGFPCVDAIDVDGLRDAAARAMRKSAAQALLYGSVQGHQPLRELIAERCRGYGTRLEAPDLLITSGSQQGIDLVARTMIDPGDTVAVEAPTYLGALQAFQAQGAKLVSVPTDADGLDVVALERIIEQHRPKLLYLIPNFANPTGAVLALRRRKPLLDLAQRYGVLLVEDDAYGELYFRDPPPPSLLSLATDDEREWVVHLSSFSKILAPGLRLAWIAAPGALMRHLLLAKQISDTHASATAQLVAFHFLNAGSLEPALSRARGYYAKQATVMQRSIGAELGDIPLRAALIRGGMFHWLELPEVDTNALLQQAVQAGVAFVPGAPFFADGTGSNYLRLSFASATADQIGEGMRRLAQAIRTHDRRASVLQPTPR
ncbi:2-aminoadipate transaminase [Paraburkholderia atlantica]|uniref:aminotransferase-like domain-containing protein n=1 Tax=Paraburkholderia atlantica TaxID=2654982 RepID=UPI003D191438